MIHILIFGLFAFAIIMGLLIFSYKKRCEIDRILDSIDTTYLKRINAKYSSYSESKFRIIVGMTTKSYLYLCEKYILIIPRNNSLFKIASYTLPIVITRNIDEARESFQNVTIIKPDRIRITGWNSIIIFEYDDQTPIDTKRKYTIKLENKVEFEYFKEIKIENWC